MNILKSEVEKNLNIANYNYNEESYCISLKTEKQTLNKVNKIKKLGYKVKKTTGLENHYTISR
jgi:hypothetical protein